MLTVIVPHPQVALPSIIVGAVGVFSVLLTVISFKHIPTQDR